MDALVTTYCGSCRGMNELTELTAPSSSAAASHWLDITPYSTHGLFYLRTPPSSRGACIESASKYFANICHYQYLPAPFHFLRLPRLLSRASSWHRGGWLLISNMRYEIAQPSGLFGVEREGLRLLSIQELRQRVPPCRTA
jgi:hypothetical protein